VILDKFSLKGKTAIVTGASRGLGEGMARALAEAGAELLIVASSERIHQAAAGIRKDGYRCAALKADLGDIAQVPTVIEAALKEYGKIDILLNAAGIIRRAPALEFTEKDWDDVMNVNLKSMFFLSQAAAREMAKRKKGKIINICSLLSFQGGIIVPSYTAAKSGAAGITRALANEWAPLGINVNGIAPGYMATEMTEALQKSAERAPAILARIPAGRWGTPEDMQGAAVFLASEASDYLHGTIITVDGGWMSR